jgi:hypothetical protein
VALETEFTFTLPKGYVDGSGTLHRHGTMRLATARDEIEPLRDARITGPDDPYLTILVIARVITALGTLRQVTPNEVEGLFAADLAFLQDLYGIVNFGDPADAAQLQASVLPPERPAAPQPAEADPEPVDAQTAHANGAVSEPVEVDEGNHVVSEPTSRRRSRIEEVPSRAES